MVTEPATSKEIAVMVTGGLILYFVLLGLIGRTTC